MQYNQLSSFVSRRQAPKLALVALGVLALASVGCNNTRQTDGASLGKDSTSGARAEVASTGLELAFDDLSAERTGTTTRFSGLSVAGIPGQPALPLRVVRILVDPRADLKHVSVTFEATDESKLAGTYHVNPVEPTKRNGVELWPAGARIEAGKDMAVYGKDELFPASNVATKSTGQLDRFKIVEVAISPYRYNPETGELRVVKGGRLVVSAPVEDGSVSAVGSAPPDRRHLQQLSSLVDNLDEGLSAYLPTPSAASGTVAVAAEALTAGANGFAILTTNAIKNGSQYLGPFVEAKTAHGFAVKVVTESATFTRSNGAWSCGTSCSTGWGGGTGDAAAERLRAWLRSNYVPSNLAYALLIGNPDPLSGDVPMKNAFVDVEDTPTDYYYADLSSNWDVDGDGRFGELSDDVGGYDRFAEISVGRIPNYGVLGELDHILAKTIAYGNAPPSSIAWRKNALLISKPIDAVLSNYMLNEWIRAEYLSPNGWSTTRVYDRDFGAAPEYTPCTYNTVLSAWRAAPRGLVVWNTHGSPEDASEVMSSTEGATKVDDLHPAFVVQNSCNNAWPELSSNLGYALLRNGAIATLAATRVGGSGSMPLNPGNSESSVTNFYVKALTAKNLSAGDALSSAHADSIWCWHDAIILNLYGDPSLGLGTTGTAAIEIPRAPTATVASVGDGSATLSWPAIPAASSYRVLRATTSTGPFTSIATTTSHTGYKDTGLTNGTTYYYVVTGISPGGESGNSLAVSARPTAPVGVQYRHVDTSTSDNLIRPYFKITNTDTSSLALSSVKLRYWFTDENPGTTTFSCESGGVACSTVNAQIVRLQTPISGADAYLEIGFTSLAPTLAAGQSSGEIRIQLRHTASVNFTETNDYSYNASRTTFASHRGVTAYRSGQLAWGDEPAEVPMPYGPLFTGAFPGNGRVTLVWGGQSNAVSFNVYRSVVGGTLAKIANVTAPQYVDTSVVNGTTYVYALTSVAANNIETPPEWSTLEPVTPSASLPSAPPPAPTGLVAEERDGFVDVGWDLEPGVTVYNLKRARSASGPYVTLAALNVASESGRIWTSVVDLNDGATYYLSIAAANSFGEGPNSPYIVYRAGSLTTLPAQVTELSATPGDGQVTLGWAAVSGATGYHVKRSIAGGTLLPLADTTVTSLTDRSLTNGTTYSYVVSAYNALGVGLDSAMLTATPMPQQSEPCSPAQDMTGGQSGNFNTTGPICKRTTDAIHGWGCSNFDGRSVKVNGSVLSCGTTQLPERINGYYYFDVSAGDYSWASIYWW